LTGKAEKEKEINKLLNGTSLYRKQGIFYSHCSTFISYFLVCNTFLCM